MFRAVVSQQTCTCACCSGMRCVEYLLGSTRIFQQKGGDISTIPFSINCLYRRIGSSLGTGGQKYLIPRPETPRPNIAAICHQAPARGGRRAAWEQRVTHPGKAATLKKAAAAHNSPRNSSPTKLPSSQPARPRTVSPYVRPMPPSPIHSVSRASITFELPTPADDTARRCPDSENRAGGNQPVHSALAMPMARRSQSTGTACTTSCRT